MWLRRPGSASSWKAAIAQKSCARSRHIRKAPAITGSGSCALSLMTGWESSSSPPARGRPTTISRSASSRRSPAWCLSSLALALRMSTCRLRRGQAGATSSPRQTKLHQTRALATNLVCLWLVAAPASAQMVLVMESDGSLTPSRSQDSFARNYNDGIGQGSASDGLAILGERGAEPEDLQTVALLRPAPLPRADVLTAIEATALRYAAHPGLRRADLSVRDWLTLYRANIEVESAYRQDAVSSVGAIGLGQLMPATARDLGVDPRDPMQNLDGSARYLAMMLETFGDPRLALAAYNAGPEAVRQHGGIPPYRETQNHVARVMAVVARLERSNS